MDDKDKKQPNSANELDIEQADAIALQLSDRKQHDVAPDKATALLVDHQIAFSPSSPEAKCVLRKIDTRIMPLLVAMHAVCRDFKDLAICRFLLGAIEVCTMPVVIMVLGAWYSKGEQVKRVAIWNTSTGWAHLFGGFLAWCIYQADQFRWQALFILYGCMTFTLGLVLYFLLAASPTDATWLTDREKAIALERVRENKTGTEIWKFNPAQLKESFLDIRFYLIFMLLAATGLPNGGLTVFGPSIIAGFGYSTEQSTLLSIAPGAVTIGGLCPLILSCVGVVMMFTIPEKNYAARYGGYVLILLFPISVLFVVTFMTAGVAGSTKKVAFGAVYQIGYTVGNLVGPQTFQPGDAPNYYTAKYTMLAFILLTIILMAALDLTHWYWNHKRDKHEAIHREESDPQLSIVKGDEGFADLTDFQQKSFRYPL
ncbi:hypothetical protein FE257_002686 [Aspergillus nanangensis]|uniref:Allantoate permease n=1 Tax=Aspergillus nanangensis TaxID=2582783 RepID=A0AAD4CDS5_ASPNN|nr:hypothetical protein FE257_002686 [Aspergillus nanangensis]